MRNTALWFIVLTAIAANGGCAITSGLEAAGNRSKINNLEVGMNTQQVLGIMGKPYRKEANPEGEIWIYRTDSYFKGIYSADSRDSSFTPLKFTKHGKLEGWGRTFYQSGSTERKEYDLNLN